MLFLSYLYYIDHISRDPLCGLLVAQHLFFFIFSLGSHVSHEFPREKIRDATHTKGWKKEKKKGYVTCVYNKAQGHIHNTQRKGEFLSVTPRDQLFR